jgi:hypothetical protein
MSLTAFVVVAFLVPFVFVLGYDLAERRFKRADPPKRIRVRDVAASAGTAAAFASFFVPAVGVVVGTVVPLAIGLAGVVGLI